MIILAEEQTGNDAKMIKFPSLIMCMGVVVEMADGRLIGAHITPSGSEPAVMAALLGEINNHGGAMNRMYCVSHYGEHTKYGAGTVANKANAIGFHGTAYLLDLDNKDKASVETYSDVTHVIGARCRVRYKRMAKIEKIFNPGAGGGMNLTDLRLKTKKNIFKKDVSGTWHVAADRDLTTINIP